MARREDVLGYLTRTPLFSACSKKDLALVSKHSEHLKLPAGTEMTTEGRVGYEFYVIVDGKATVSKKGKPVATLGPGDAFGELSLLDRAPRNATVTADTDIDVVLLGQREFNALLDLVPTLAHKLLVGLARRIHEVDNAAVN
ncbi:MAG TPA: cyclic nucleotide-binding domain-containing protein [Acidimicrobiales bacterium]|nr:cyclic nucleotide-binding domain-containing protein [Acidimicrobiales bacterium]